MKGETHKAHVTMFRIARHQEYDWPARRRVGGKIPTILAVWIFGKRQHKRRAGCGREGTEAVLSWKFVYAHRKALCT